MAWLSAAIRCGADSAEELSDSLLGVGALSADIGDAHAGDAGEEAIFGEPGMPSGRVWRESVVTALFSAGDDVPALIGAAARIAGLAQTPKFQIAAIAEQDWVRLTQSQFEPIPISRRLWIVPSWHAAPDRDAVNIELDPGLAFGTGSHPTTRLCLRWLDQHLAGGETVLDYGCGSGILAIAALKLGAATAVGIDIDPQAVMAARQNAARNQVAAQFYLPAAAPAIEAQIVVANILANPLKVLAPLLARLTRPSGRVVLSGILAEQAEDVRVVYQAWFEMDTALEEDGWVCLSGVRS